MLGEVGSRRCEKTPLEIEDGKNFEKTKKQPDAKVWTECKLRK